MKAGKSDTKPIKKKEDVQASSDEHIDQDFPGYPHPQAEERTINPKTKEDKAGANLIKKEKADTDEGGSDGSANAFEASENDEVLRDELNKEKGKKNSNENY
jgi:hypothetical protein